jgi:hypothetical protein
MEEELGYIVLYIFSTPIGLLRWLIFRKKGFKSYLLEDAKYILQPLRLLSEYLFLQLLFGGLVKISLQV